MDYAANSFAGPVLFGEQNPNPTHFQHIAAWQEFNRLARIKADCSRRVARIKRSRYAA